MRSGTLAQYMVMHNSELFVPAATAWKVEQVRLKVRDIVGRQLDLGSEFDDDADFLNDLGMS